MVNPAAFLDEIDLDAQPALDVDGEMLPWVEENWRARVKDAMIESPSLPEETAAHMGVSADDARVLVAEVFFLWFRRHRSKKSWRRAYHVGEQSDTAPAMVRPVPRARGRRVRRVRRTGRHARAPARGRQPEDDPPDATAGAA